MKYQYDIIGDIHGHAFKLNNLLHKLGYENRNGLWSHPERKVVFLGDFLDRGPEQVLTYRIARSMIEAGYAHAIMGNHEFNAIAFYTRDDMGMPLRKRSKKNIDQHKEFISQVGSCINGEDARRHEISPIHCEIIKWAKTLPLWLELDGIRAVHACWKQDHIDFLATKVGKNNTLTETLIYEASQGIGNSFNHDGSVPDVSPEFHAVETILKGVEIKLPHPYSYKDADGHERSSTRVRWWDSGATTYRTAALIPGNKQNELPDIELPKGVINGYEDEIPLFIGHYWMSKTPEVLKQNLACVDYSAGKGGPLAAYCWSGEKHLRNENFVVSM